MPCPTISLSRRRSLVMVSVVTDEEMDELEAQLPAKAGVAFAAARRRVLASGQSILVSENGVIYERFPDGHRVSLNTSIRPSRLWRER
jgi:hypothetical protein